MELPSERNLGSGMTLLLLLGATGLSVAEEPAPLFADSGCGSIIKATPSAQSCAEAAAAQRSPRFAWGGPNNLCAACSSSDAPVPASNFNIFEVADFVHTAPMPVPEPSPSTMPTPSAPRPAPSAASPPPPPPRPATAAAKPIFPEYHCGGDHAPDAIGARAGPPSNLTARSPPWHAHVADAGALRGRVLQ